MKTENAINQQQIDEWKAEYGKIFRTTVGENTVIWRKLRRKEYVHIMSNEATQDIECDKVYARQDLIVAAVTLYPENIEELVAEAGIPDLIVAGTGPAAFTGTKQELA